MAPIRILNMFTILNRGGAETMVMNYYRHIDRTKVQFDFLVHRQERGAYEDEIEGMGGKIYHMIPIFPQKFINYQKLLKKFFNEHKEYEIIHSHMSELGCFALIEAEKQGVPIRICHAHSAPRGFDIKTIVREYFKIRMRPYITHMFMCALESGIWLYGKENKDNFIMQNNAIDAKKFSYNYDISIQIRQELNIENKFVIGHVGRFEKPKNHRFLIDIFHEVYKKDPNSILVLIGEGTLENGIKEKVSKLGLNEVVKFLGVRDDISRVIQGFDVFLFPSLCEGLGMVLIEAQAAGIQCITSDEVVPVDAKVTDLLEYVSLKKNADYWADKVLKYKNGYERKNTNDQIVKAKYDIKENAKWLEEFYINEFKKSI